MEKVGNIIGILSYFKVKKIKDNSVELESLNPESKIEKMEVDSLILEGELFSADTFDKTEKVNKHDLVKVLLHSGGKPFTVSYEKENGEERILRGRFMSHDADLGRSLVWDFEKNQPRQVDHRTIEFIIVNKVKYILK